MKDIAVNTSTFLKLSTTNPGSRYYQSEILSTQDNVSIYGLYQYNRQVITFGDGQYHVVTEAERDRIDKVAYKYYGNVNYWWVIAEANNMIDPFTLVPDTTIFIPQKLNNYNI